MTLSPAQQREHACRDLEIAQLRIQGATYKKIAEQFELTESRACQILSKPEIKDVVDTGINNLVNYIPVSINAFCKLLLDKDAPDHYKAVKDHLQTMGILASHSGGNVYIQNVYNAIQAADITQVNRFADMISQRQELDVIEAEYSEND